jgi:endogenous inhibitor of DNA gyrase (YacG/DUF329 family)
MDTGAEAAPDRPLDSHRRRTTGTCGECGAPLEQYAGESKRTRRFCSEAHCQRAYYRANRDHIREQQRRRWAGRKRERGPRPVETACLRCGKPVLVGPIGRIRRYCSRSCRQLALVARRREQSQETPASAQT